MSDVSQEPKKIDIDNFSTLSAENKEGLLLLLDHLAPIWSENSYPVRHLDLIVIVPEDEIQHGVAAVRATGKYLGKNDIRTKHTQAEVLGAAAPFEADGQLKFTIFIADKVVQSLTPKKHHPALALEVITEEYLHVWSQGLAWERRGGTLELKNPLEPAEAHFLSNLAVMFEEYIVSMTKLTILSSIPLIDAEDGKEGFTTCELAFNDDEFLGHVQKGEQLLRKHILEIGTGLTTVEERWQQFCYDFYRFFLDPLVRQTAARWFYGFDEEVLYKPETLFFKEVFAPYWRKIHNELKRAVTDIGQTEAAIETSMEILRDFLEHIGVSYWREPNGEPYAHFDATFFILNPQLCS